MRYDSNAGAAVPELPTATDIVTGASKGSNLASDVTATAVDANHTGLDVNIPGGVTLTGGSTVTANQGAAGAAAWLVTATTLPLPSGAATEATVASLLARLPTALVGGRLDVNIGAPATLPVSLASVPSHPVDTELPAAAAPGDTDANPTAPYTVAANMVLNRGTGQWERLTRISADAVTNGIAAAGMMIYNGATMDRLRGDTTSGAWVNVKNASLAVTAASLPLPTGAAQEHITAAGFHAVRLTDGAAFYDGRDITDRAARLVGHVTVDNASLAITAASLPLPAGAAQEHTTAISPHAVRVTDGAAFYDTRTTNNGVQSVLLAWEEMAGTAAVESTLTNATFLTQNMVALTAASTYTVPAAKRFRITNVSCYVKATSTVNNLAKFRLRAVASGSVLNTSPPVFNTVLALSAPGTVAAGLLVEEAYSVPEGSLDFPTGAQLTFTWNTAANTCTVGMTVIGYLYTP